MQYVEVLVFSWYGWENWEIFLKEFQDKSITFKKLLINPTAEDMDP